MRNFVVDGEVSIVLLNLAEVALRLASELNRKVVMFNMTLRRRLRCTPLDF